MFPMLHTHVGSSQSVELCYKVNLLDLIGMLSCLKQVDHSEKGFTG
jgi:hypothetical protein